MPCQELVDKINALEPRAWDRTPEGWKKPRLSDDEWRAILAARRRGVHFSDIYAVIPSGLYKNEKSFANCFHNALNRLKEPLA